MTLAGASRPPHRLTASPYRSAPLLACPPFPPIAPPLRLLVRGDSAGQLCFSSRDSSGNCLEELQAITEGVEGAAQAPCILRLTHEEGAACRRDLGGNLGGKQASPVEQQRPGGRSRAEVASLAFARLKEATGVERAFLCGMLALPEASLPELPSRAFAGFVLVVQAPR